MRIAILAWGSLLWDGGREFEDQHGSWQNDGPQLKLEFSRVSRTRLGALTLVIDEEQGTPTTVAWCVSIRQHLEDAVCDLRCREGTTAQYVGRIVVNGASAPASPGSAPDTILAWAKDKNLDGVVWTDLRSNFTEKTNEPSFSVGTAIAYVKTLSPAGKAKAAEYVWRAPEFVRTPVRSALQQEPWFSAPGR
jgi:hypothetical protein